MTTVDYSSLHVLLIEDDVLMRRLAESILHGMHVSQISSATDGQEGLKLLREAKRPVDIVICDLMMPNMNGMDFVFTVRRGDDIPDPKVPILVVTGYANEEIVRGAAKLGVDGYLVKPISREALESRMNAALNRRNDATVGKFEDWHPVNADLHPIDVEAAKFRVLVVEDDPFNRALMIKQLKAQGYTDVTQAENGRVALEKISQNSFDAVLLDIHMPELDGFAVLQSIHSDLSLRDIPVIMVSSVDAIDSVARCIEMGAEDYLLKPFEPTLLRARLAAGREKKRLRDLEKSHVAQVKAEKRRADELLTVILPVTIANELKASGRVATRAHQNVAILFADIVEFTAYCDTHAAEDVVANLQKLFIRFEEITSAHGMEKIKTIGDSFMAAAGLVNPDPEPLLTAVRCGLEMGTATSSVTPDWSVRVGVHCGPVVAGVVGDQKYQYDVWGDTVNVAARMADAGRPGTVAMTHDAWLSVDDTCKARRIGSVSVKGKGSLDVVECYALID